MKKSNTTGPPSEMSSKRSTTYSDLLERQRNLIQQHGVSHDMVNNSDKIVGEHTGFIRMRGLSFTTVTKKQDVYDFFEKNEPVLDSILNLFDVSW